MHLFQDTNSSTPDQQRAQNIGAHGQPIAKDKPSAPPGDAADQTARRGRRPLSDGPRQRRAYEIFAEQEGRNWPLMAEKSGVAERTLQRWAAELGWRQRLLDRDEHLRLEREAQLAKERAKRLDQQLAVGTLLRQRAHQHFLNNKITRCVDAIQAAKVSIEIERQADLLPDFLIKISCATPEELATMRAELEAERSAAIANGSFVPTPPRRPEHEKELRNANYNE